MSDINNTGLSKPQMKNLMKFLSDATKIPVLGAGGGFAPIGMYGWSPDYVTGAPQGWLRCEGQEVNIADYPELATFYASQHGASNFWGGDGITTFAVPDLRGEFIRGAGTNSHANQGNGGAVGEHQDGTIVDASFDSGMINYSLPSGYTMNYDWFIENGRRNTIRPTTVNEGDGRLGTTRPTNTSGVFFVKATVSGDANGEVYSTDETICGTWIDGSRLYQKTIDCGVMPNATTKNVNHNIANVDIVFIESGFFISNDGLSGTLPYTNTGSGKNVKIIVDRTKVSIISEMDLSQIYKHTYVTIKYTKTQ